MKRCPVCESKKIKLFSHIKKLPLILFPVSGSIKNKIIRKDINSFICANCHHIFTDNLNKEDEKLIYQKYYSYYPFENLESMKADYRRPFNKICSKFLKNNLSLLEIGCSSGKDLDVYKKYNIKAYGIDPSPLLGKTDKRLISGYYENYEFPLKFDLIVSKFSFEHCQNIYKLMNKIKKDLKNDGLLFIQVPNIQTFIENSIPLFIAHEHIHYFSPYSLLLTAAKNDFEVVDGEFNHKQGIIFVLKKTFTNKVDNSMSIKKITKVRLNRYLKNKSKIAEGVKKVLQNSNICLYGTGLTLAWILYELNLISLVKKFQIIDDNPLVKGRFMPFTSKCNMIKDFNSIRNCKKIIFLLTLNPSYHKIIIEKISKKFPNSPIYFINNKGLNLLK